MSETQLTLALITTALAVGAVSARSDLTGLDLSVHDADIAPAVTLREYDNRVVQEYRVNNNLYMIKVTPSVGAPYYLIDQDGSGDMAWNRGTPGFEQRVPQWTLLSW